jgi:hypothetical protein
MTPHGSKTIAFQLFVVIIRQMSYDPDMPIDYVQLLRELMKDRESWARKRDDADREFSRLSDLIRSTVKMLSPEERDQCVGDLIEHFDHVYSPGLTNLVRGAFGSGKEWLTPTQIRAYLGSIGFNFEKYKANPMASIHTTLRRMVPNEVECKIVDGQKLYRLKTVEHWGASMLEDVRGWLDQNGVKAKRKVAEVVVVKRRDKAGVQGKKRS